MKISIKLLLLAVAALGLGNCEMPETKAPKGDKLLARVHNISLYLSDLEGMFPTGTTPQDSSLIISAFVERWVRDALLLYEGEKNIPKDLNIDKLVEDYRASLIRLHYEKSMVSQLLDSVITKEELIAFYEENKEQYQLETPILRCQFIKIPLPVEHNATLRGLWNSRREEDMEKLIEFCKNSNATYLLSDSIWHRQEEIEKLLPPGIISSKNVRERLDLNSSDNEFQYFFRVLEVKNTKEIAPLSYIEDQARKVILRRRKIMLLEEKKDEMYELGLRRNDIQLFID